MTLVRSAAAAVLGSGSMLVAHGAPAQQDPGGGRQAWQHESRKPAHPPAGEKGEPISDSITLRLMGELEEAAQRSRSVGEDPRIGSDVPVDRSPGSDYWSGPLQVVQISDPLIGEECRRGAVLRALQVTGEPDAIRAHIVEEARDWDEALEGSKPIHMSEYLDHLTECDEFCWPLMGLLLKCHIDAVRASPHVIVFFDVDRPRVGESHDRALAGSAQRDLSVFASEMARQGRDLVLYSRASILGASESYAHNRQLAARRAQAVEAALREAGFRGRVMRRLVGWEPPRLAVREISAYFGFEPQWFQQPNPQYMDQSVLAVGY